MFAGPVFAAWFELWGSNGKKRPFKGVDQSGQEIKSCFC